MQILDSFGVVSLHVKELCNGFVLTHREREKIGTCLARRSLAEQSKIVCVFKYKGSYTTYLSWLHY